METLGQIIRQSCAGIAQIINIYAAKSNYQNQYLNILESGFRHASVLDWSNKIEIISAVALTLSATIDDFAINSHLYESHHLTKIAAAGYIGYKSCEKFDKSQELSIVFGTILYGFSELFSGDQINTARYNMTNIIKLSEQLEFITDDEANLDSSLYTGMAIGAILNTGRQIINEKNYKIDTGTSITHIISGITFGGISLFTANNTIKELEYAISSRLLKLTENDFNYLQQDPRAKHILEHLPTLVKSASSIIQNVTLNASIKGGVQQMWAYQNNNLGFQYTTLDYLLNITTVKSLTNITDNKEYSFAKDVSKGGFDGLNMLKNYASTQTFTVQNNAWAKFIGGFYSCSQTLIKALICSFLNVQSDETFINPEFFSKHFTAIGMGTIESFVTTQDYGAFDELAYLVNAMDELESSI